MNVDDIQAQKCFRKLQELGCKPEIVNEGFAYCFTLSHKNEDRIWTYKNVPLNFVEYFLNDPDRNYHALTAYLIWVEKPEK